MINLYQKQSDAELVILRDERQNVYEGIDLKYLLTFCDQCCNADDVSDDLEIYAEDQATTLNQINDFEQKEISRLLKTRVKVWRGHGMVWVPTAFESPVFVENVPAYFEEVFNCPNIPGQHVFFDFGGVVAVRDTLPVLSDKDFFVKFCVERLKFLGIEGTQYERKRLYEDVEQDYNLNKKQLKSLHKFLELED